MVAVSVECYALYAFVSEMGRSWDLVSRESGDVDAFGFVRQRGDVNRDQSLCPALEFTLALVLAQRLGLGRRHAVVDGDGVVHHRLLAFNYENRFASVACAEDRCPNPFWDEAP